MKSLDELKAIRERAKFQLKERQDHDGYRVVVGMATCGIAAGARPVMTAFMDEVQKQRLENVTVAQTGCIGMCRLEPMVEVFEPSGEKVTYIKMTDEKARKVIEQHIKKGTPVIEYTIGTEQ